MSARPELETGRSRRFDTATTPFRLPRQAAAPQVLQARLCAAESDGPAGALSVVGSWAAGSRTTLSGMAHRDTSTGCRRGDRKWLVCRSRPWSGSRGYSRVKSPGAASTSSAAPLAWAIR